MLKYPIKLQKDTNNTVLATAPDFPEVTTFGDDNDDALSHAVDAVEEAIAARIAAREDIPAPGKVSKTGVELATQTAIKVLLYQTMRKQKVSKAELGRRLALHRPQVDRLLDIHHTTHLQQIDAAMAAMGGKLHVSAE
ncbi:MAG: type II toxin-antitoxin system HicB family antitoxin [Alphaproteobacteria bacterium]|jgi:antitoxin HicB|nr:type II toxin-antitoxin system HicB family antitoxin [Alphaproteobacteria bacterium]